MSAVSSIPEGDVSQNFFGVELAFGQVEPPRMSEVIPDDPSQLLSLSYGAHIGDTNG